MDLAAVSIPHEDASVFAISPLFDYLELAMKKERLPGILLISVAVLILLGFALGNPYY